MKTQTRTRVVKMSDDSNVKDYTVELSADFFDIIINNIYTDKISSVIREIGCNAYDAHVVNGNEETPIEVHLPSELEPYFYIKDQGTGLPEHKMDSLYTCLGASDKRDNNNTTGCKGIGSKSPFAYSDSFTVESCYDGERKLYSCFIGEDGKPKIKTTFTQDTNQPNGLMVQLPVKYNDFYTFEKKCMNVMKHFKVTPNIVGRFCEFPDRKVILEGSCWRLYETKQYETYCASVIMGNVSYPLETNSKITDESPDYLPLLSSNLEIDFDLGDLNPAGGRERLQYDDFTVSKVCQKLDIVNKEILVHIESKVQKCDTLWKARCEFLKLIEGFYHMSTLRKMDIKYNKKTLFSDGTNVHIKKFLNTHMKDGDVAQDKTDYIYSLDRYSNKKHNYEIYKITPNNNQTFVINDIEAGAISRSIQYYGDNPGTNIIYIHIEDKKQLAKLITYLGDPVTLLASELPKFRIKKRLSDREPATKIQVFDGTRFRAHNMWINSEKTTADDGIFLEINRYKYKDNSGNFVYPQNLSDILDILKTLGHEPTIYGIKSMAMKQKRMIQGTEGDKPRWLCFWKFAIRVLETELTKFNIPLTLANYRERISSIQISALDKVRLHTTAKDVQKFYRHLDAVKDGIFNISIAQSLENLAHHCSTKLDVVDPIYPVVKELSDIRKKYPLIKYCTSIDKNDQKHLGIYINQIEKEIENAN